MRRLRMSGLFTRLRAALTDAHSLRGWIAEANDGIIVTAGVLEGFAGAGASDSTLVTAAIATTLAGGLSIGGAQWSGASAERDAQLRLAAEEAEQLSLHPEEELRELAGHYEAKGLDADLAMQVAQQLTARDAIGAQLQEEHGIREIMTRAEPIRLGAAAGFAFVVGASVPLLITAAVPGQVETWAILVAVLASLTITSIIGARSGHTPIRQTLFRTLGVGIFTLGASYLLGQFLF